HHRRVIDDLAVVFGLVLGPDRLHRLDLLAHLLEARRVDRAVLPHLVLVPAAADAEQETAARDLVDRGDELCGLDRVTLNDEAYAGAELDGFGRRRGRGERHKRVHHVVILLRQFAAAGERRLAGQRDVRVLWCPDRLETAL